MRENGMVCPACAQKLPGILSVSPACFRALYYIVHAERKKVFAFRIGNEVQQELGNLAEKYILRHLDKDFPSLSYYKRMI